MGVEVLVAHCFFAAFDPKQAARQRPYPPLATLYVAAALRAAGHEVALFDAMLATGEWEYVDQLDGLRPAVVVLYEDNFNYLSKMCLTRMRDAAVTMIAEARARNAVVIVAGSDVTDHPELYLAAGAHFAVVGEGDHTVTELVDWIGAGHAGSERPVPVPGVVTLDGEAPVATGRRPNERHPDVFCWPARDLVDIDAYRQIWRQRHGEFSLNMVSTRGCPFHCNWCAKPIWGQRYAMRSAADVAAELALVKRRYRPDHVWFADDIFGLRTAWLVEFAEAVAAEDASVPFTIQSRCDLMTEGAVAALAKAGCREVWLGAESGSQSVLDAMDKGITVDEIRTARRLLGEAGIRACFFIQLGYPGETWSDLAATIALVQELLPDDIGVSVSYPLPGTRFHAMVASQLGAKTNWESSDDLDMLFAGTYTSTFYRHLHRCLHDDLDWRRRQLGLPRAPHPSITEVDAVAQRLRVTEGWRELERLESASRAARPTRLIKLTAVPARPDLAASHN